MAAITYDELVRFVPIQLYAENTVLQNEMPNIIRQAEDQLLLVIDHDIFQTVLPPLILPAGDSTIDLTAQDPRILEVRSISARYRGRGWQSLERRSLEYLRSLYIGDKPGDPLYYSERGDINLLEVFPTPRVDVDLEILANVEAQRLSPTAQTNRLTQEYPRAVEKACFYHASFFMKKFDAAQVYEKEMGQAVQETSMALARRRRDETGTRPVETSNARGE